MLIILPVYILFITHPMAEAIKSLRRISKRLQQTFKSITFYAARHLAHSKTYGAEYMNQYRQIEAKLRKDKQKERVKRNKKYKDEKSKLKKQLEEAKAKNKEKEKRRKERDESQDSVLSESRSQDKDTRKIQKNLRNIDEDRRIQGEESKDINIQSRKQQKRVSFDLNKPYQQSSRDKPRTKDIQTSRQQQTGQQRKIRKIKKWSSKKPEGLGSLDPTKYKIMRIDEQVSDFQDQNAPRKVPAIKPREPLTAYFLFLRYNRHSIQEGYPNIHRMGNFMQIWKALPQQQKKPYKDQQLRAQAIYAKKMAQYYAANPRSLEERGQERYEPQKAQNQGQDIKGRKRQTRSKTPGPTKQKSARGRGSRGNRSRKKVDQL